MARVFTFRTPSNRVFAIAEQQHLPQTNLTNIDHHVVLFPTRHVPNVPAEPPAIRPPARALLGDCVPGTRSGPQVAVPEVVGRLSDVVEDLDTSIQMAFAGEPRGMVCDVSAVVDGADHGAVESLATAGRHSVRVAEGRH